MVTENPFQQFPHFQEELERYDQQREELIIKARKLNVLAKKALYHAHRDESEQAKNTLDQARPLAEHLITTYHHDWKNKIGAVTAALQEWAESNLYNHYLQEKTLLPKEALGIETEDYLLALSDLSGELVRKAVNYAIDHQRGPLKQLHRFLEELYGAFIPFNFRNGELRKKTDSIRWNLQKVEELLARQSSPCP